MEGRYDVLLGDNPAGTMCVTREGLYYHFSCNCKLSRDLCRLKVRCEDTEEDLGTLVPGPEGFCLERKIPVKRFGSGTPVFTVVPKKPVVTGKFVPIYPEEPFVYIEKLKNAHLTRQNGQVGILLTDIGQD